MSRGRYKVTFDTQELILYEDVIIKNNLLLEKNITIELLEKVINENSIKVGEFVKFQKVDKVPIERTIRKKAVNGKREVFTKTSFKDIWDCSIIGRNEKNLQVNKTKNQTKYKSEIVELTDLEKKNAEFLKMKKEKEAKQGLNLSSQNKGNKFVNLKKKEDLER